LDILGTGAFSSRLQDQQPNPGTARAVPCRFRILDIAHGLAYRAAKLQQG
jgi:hypothetical protein